MRRRGISTLMAALLLLILAISAGAIIYAYTMGFLGGFRATPSKQGVLALDSAKCTTEEIKAYIRNIGGGTVIIDRAYVNGRAVEGAGYVFQVDDSELEAGESTEVTIKIPGGFQPGRSYEVKIVGKRGAEVFFTVQPKGKAGWLGDWAKRVKLTVDHNDIDEDLTDFPLLIHISSSSGIGSDDVTFIFDEVGSNRFKIAVTTSDGVTQCYVEVEYWDAVNEEAWLWVRVPSISSSEDTVLYLYYDNSKDDNTAYVGDPGSSAAQKVWDDNYLFVSHMADDPDDSHIRDSTSNGNDGSKKDSGEPAQVSAIIGYGQEYVDDADDDDYIELYPFDYDLTEFTVSFWMKTSDTTKRGTPISCSDGASQHNELLIYNYGDFSIYLKGRNRYTRVSANDGSWHHIVVTWRNSDGEFKLYKDGSPAYTGNLQSGATINPANLIMGQEQDSFRDDFDSSQAFIGLMDEVRVSNTVRSGAWIKASYEAGIDNLIDFGGEETY